MTRRVPFIDRDPPVHELARLETRCFTDAWDEASLTRLLNNAHVGAWCLRDPDDRPVGILIFQAVEGEAEVLRIGIDPSIQRNGLGRRLLGVFVKYCRGRRFSRVVLEVRRSNSPARALYDSMGFELLGRRVDYYREPAEDSLVYELRLDTAPAAETIDRNSSAG